MTTPLGATALLAALTTPDYVVLAVYTVVVVVIGSWLGKGQDSLAGYFLADRRVPWVVACVSIIATDLSAISYMGMPAWVYEKDLKFLFGSILTPVSFLLVVLVFVPIYYRLRVFTVYEYLEKRFHPLARTLAAVLFLFQRGVWMAAAIYIPSIALSAVAGLNLIACIITIGLVTTVYTMAGGMKAVVWTDFMQFIVMMGGLLFMIGIQLHSFGWDFGAVWTRAGELINPVTQAPHTVWIDWRMDLHTEATIWALLFFYMVYNLGTYGTDQVVVQRYFTMKTQREIVWSVMSAGLLTIMVVFLLGIQGILLLVYYDGHPELAAGLSGADAVLPHFIVNVLPAGVRGLIFAAIFAATMSSVSSGLNSFATVGVMDLYRRHFGGAARSERHNFRVAKAGTLICGVLATAVAIWISTFETTILQTLVALSSKFIGPIAGIFMLGAFTKRANFAGVIAGTVCGLVASFIVDLDFVAERVNWLWTAPMSSLVTFMVGYLVSILIPLKVQRPTHQDAAADAVGKGEAP
jgi:solute:Na+ symporter, SSS family